MSSRLARDDEVTRWQEDGWVLLEGLVDPAEIDRAAAELGGIFPTREEYHADPDGVRERWLGHPVEPPEMFVWPDEGPGFRPEQHKWTQGFPFPGEGALNRLVVHASLVDFAERALDTTDLRIYQTMLTAKYQGQANYEQPMHLDRNHSWVPGLGVAPWWHIEGFLYLSDVDEGSAPTHLVSVRDSGGRHPQWGLVMPQSDPGTYAAERAAVGPKGSYLAYRTNVLHRGVDLTTAGAARFLLNVSYKIAGQDWIGYHTAQSHATDFGWTHFVEESTARELELFGFPPPGHPIWTQEVLDLTADLYPNLDLDPWRSALAGPEPG
jgi:hypothetical protein